MIKFENTNVVGWESAIRGMRNPLNSWNRSDSYKAVDCGKCGKIEREGICEKEGRDCTGFECYALGKNDIDLMRRLRYAGTEHRKYLRMIVVYVDITAPLYWWKEFDTYKVGTVANSCSTMHKIADKEFELEDFSYDHLQGSAIASLKSTISLLNYYRDLFNFAVVDGRIDGIDGNEVKKEHWWQMIQLLPSSYNQKRTVLLNYEVLNNIYKSRKNHKLDEWSVGFMNWIKSLPYAKELIIGEN